MRPKIAVIGAGLAGLYCGKLLLDDCYDVEIFERSDSIGGRMKTDKSNGYLLDHGFHVLQTGYQYSSTVFDYELLNAKSFQPGALVIRSSTKRSRIWRLSDPFRRPLQALRDGLGFFASPLDFLKVVLMRRKIRKLSIDSLFQEGESSTEKWLIEQGFSQRFIDRFFYPLFSGIFLESDLRTNERMFKFVFRSMSDGDMVLPEHGIQSIPNYIASSIESEKIFLNSNVELESNESIIVDGDVRTYDAVVIAFDNRIKRSKKHVWTLYFSADKSPLRSSHIMLNSEVRTHNNLISYIAVPSDVQPSYAPSGKSLISVTVLGEIADRLDLKKESEITSKVESELMQWFGEIVSKWQLISIQHIQQALPESDSIMFDNPDNNLNDGYFYCGDFMTHGSVEGTLISAKQAVQSIKKKLPFGN